MTVSASHGPSERLSHIAGKLRLYADMLETIIDAGTVIELLAQVFEYEHALEHVAGCAEGGCSDCVKVARSALARDNRQDFTESARDQFADDEPDKFLWPDGRGELRAARLTVDPDRSVTVVQRPSVGAVPCDYPDCPSLAARPFEATRRQDGVTLLAEVRGCAQRARWASRRAKAEVSR